MIKDKKGIEIKALIEQSELEICRIYNEKYATNRILEAGAQKPGLSLSGYSKYLNRNQVQIFGKTETGYLMQLSESEREKCLKTFLSLKIPGIIISENQEIDDSIITTAQ